MTDRDGGRLAWFVYSGSVATVVAELVIGFSGPQWGGSHGLPARYDA